MFANTGQVQGAGIILGSSMRKAEVGPGGRSQPISPKHKENPFSPLANSARDRPEGREPWLAKTWWIAMWGYCGLPGDPKSGFLSLPGPPSELSCKWMVPCGLKSPFTQNAPSSSWFFTWPSLVPCPHHLRDWIGTHIKIGTSYPISL